MTSQPPTRLSGLNSVYSRTTTSEQPPVPLHSPAICNSWIRANTLRAYFCNQLRLHTATQVLVSSRAPATFQAIDAVGWQLTGAELAALRTQCVVV